MKKFQILLLIIILGILVFPQISFAGEYKADGKTIKYEGLVPCGKSQKGPGESPEVTNPCQFCHFFVMFKGIIDFVLFKIVFPIATLLLVVGGGMFFLYTEDPKKIETAKSLLKSVVIGLLIIFAAWLVVNIFFMIIGVADWTSLKEGWWHINCPIKL